jgi:hypothetical protein
MYVSDNAVCLHSSEAPFGALCCCAFIGSSGSALTYARTHTSWSNKHLRYLLHMQVAQALRKGGIACMRLLFSQKLSSANDICAALGEGFKPGPLEPVSASLLSVVCLSFCLSVCACLPHFLSFVGIISIRVTYTYTHIYIHIHIHTCICGPQVIKSCLDDDDADIRYIASATVRDMFVIIKERLDTEQVRYSAGYIHKNTRI